MVKFWNVGMRLYTHPSDPSSGQSPRLASDRGPAWRPLGTKLATPVGSFQQKMNEPAKESQGNEGNGAGAGGHEEDDVDWLHGHSPRIVAIFERAGCVVLLQRFPQSRMEFA